MSDKESFVSRARGAGLRLEHKEPNTALGDENHTSGTPGFRFVRTIVMLGANPFIFWPIAILFFALPAPLVSYWLAHPPTPEQARDADKYVIIFGVRLVISALAFYCFRRSYNGRSA